MDCEECSGSGFCDACDGYGTGPDSSPNAGDGPYCEVCDATGVCATCDGDGTEPDDSEYGENDDESSSEMEVSA